MQGVTEMQWEQIVSFWPRQTIDGRRVWGQLMRKPDGNGGWLYRELTQEELADFLSRDGW